MPRCAEPEVLRGDALPPLKWTPADEEGLVQFLVNEKSFNEDRVRKAVQRVNASKSKSTQGVVYCSQHTLIAQQWRWLLP
jgi:hypothetical protein